MPHVIDGSEVERRLEDTRIDSDEKFGSTSASNSKGFGPYGLGASGKGTVD